MIFANKFAFEVTAAARQLVGRVGLFFKGSIPDHQYTTLPQYNLDNVVQRKEALLKQERCVTRSISSSLDMQVFVTIHEKWFVTNITKWVGRENHCNTAVLTRNFWGLRH